MDACLPKPNTAGSYWYALARNGTHWYVMVCIVAPPIQISNDLLEDTSAMARIWELYGDLQNQKI